jgi:TPR repeat protein
MSSNAKADYRQGVEAYKRSDYQRVLSEVRPLAEIGDPHSQFLLSLMYSEGKGVTRNDTLAYGWMKLAADAGIAQAITQEKKLGEILLPESRAAALRLLADYSPEESTGASCQRLPELRISRIELAADDFCAQRCRYVSRRSACAPSRRQSQS